MTTENDTSRVEAFSDGVFAIAITLLILEIRVPAVESIATDGACVYGLSVALAWWNAVVARVGRRVSVARATE